MLLKLVSNRDPDALIGHVEVPNHAAAILRERRYLQIAVMPKFDPAVPPYRRPGASVAPEIRTVALQFVSWSRHPDAVRLVDGTLEELEALPGFAFFPSMSFLRSHLEDRA